MIRALITAALLTGAAMHFFNADLVSRRGGRRRPPSRTPKAPAPHLTQVNHYHFYGQVPTAPAAIPRPDYSRPALPLRTEGQKAHDEVYDIIDEKGRSQDG